MAKKYKEWRAEDWKKGLFSDESQFFVQGLECRHVRRRHILLHALPLFTKGHIIQNVIHPQKKIFCGCFSFQGAGPLYPVTGMMNAEKYSELVRQKVLREMERMFPAGGGIFQHDLAPCHSAKK